MCRCTMDDSSQTYHPVRMTINGVTKSVLVPLPNSSSHGRPVTAKLPDGTAIIITPNSGTDSSSATVADKVNITTPAAVISSKYALGARQHPAIVSALTGTGAEKRSIVVVKSAVSRRPLLALSRGAGTPTVVTGTPRLPVSSPSRAVTVESPSGQRRIIHITPPTTSTVKCVRLPVSLTRPLASKTTRPIILRKSLTPVSRTAVVRPCVQPVHPTVAADPSTSAWSVVSSPRTLSRREAEAVGWYRDEVQPDTQHTSSADHCGNPPPYAVRHIVPMDTDCDYSSDVSDSSQNESRRSVSTSGPPVCNETDGGASAVLPPVDDDRIVVVDNETQTKVIEIFPSGDAAGVASDQDEDCKPAVMPIKHEFDTSSRLMTTADDFSRHCSSVSTETAVSDVELASNRDDFVVLAEWSQDELPTTDGAARRRVVKRRKRKSKKYNWFRYRKPSSESVCKARRTGGRPKSAAERYGIVDCFVSLPVMRLPKPYVDHRVWWKYVCCRRNQVQRCRCGSVSRHDLTRRVDCSKIRQLVETAGLIEPSLVASGNATLPVQLSGPTSVDGVTPLLVRQPDGKLASVVAKRTTPGGTVLDANKKKYLLIKTKTGSFLVPVSSLTGGSAAATVPTPTTHVPPTPSPSPTSPVTSKPAVLSETSGHRERIQELKERLRQQEEQLRSIRSQLGCNSVQKFDLDSATY